MPWPTDVLGPQRRTDGWTLRGDVLLEDDVFAIMADVKQPELRAAGGPPAPYGELNGRIGDIRGKFGEGAAAIYAGECGGTVSPRAAQAGVGLNRHAYDLLVTLPPGADGTVRQVCFTLWFVPCG